MAQTVQENISSVYRHCLKITKKHSGRTEITSENIFRTNWEKNQSEQDKSGTKGTGVIWREFDICQCFLKM